MMNEIIVAALGSSALAAAVSGVFTLVAGRMKARKGLNEGLGFLLLDKLKRDGKEYIASGHICMEDLQEFQQVHGAYKKLGGNGFADKIKEAVEKLPIEADE